MAVGRSWGRNVSKFNGSRHRDLSLCGYLCWSGLAAKKCGHCLNEFSRPIHVDVVARLVNDLQPGVWQRLGNLASRHDADEAVVAVLASLPAVQPIGLHFGVFRDRWSGLAQSVGSGGVERARWSKRSPAILRARIPPIRDWTRPRGRLCQFRPARDSRRDIVTRHHKRCEGGRRGPHPPPARALGFAGGRCGSPAAD